MYKFSFSIFTPVYNRGEEVKRVFDSLTKQTYKDFEWIVVNDGSTDNTDEVVKEIIEIADFNITYICFEHNSGKHVAQNRAVDVAKGELFAPLDSDDYIVPNALEILWNAWNDIPVSERKDNSGVGVHCMDQNGNMIGTPYPAERVISNDLEMVFNYKIKGEKWGVIRTDIMQQFKNEEVKGHFLSESTVWYRIARTYSKKLYLQQCLRIYEVHDDSVTKKMKNAFDYNIESTIVSECIYMNEFYHWFLKYQVKNAIRMPVALTYKCIINNKSVLIGKDALIKKVNPFMCKILILITSGYKAVWKVKCIKRK